MITLEKSVHESWFTEEGARIKKRRLQKAGIPTLKNWRFVTLTIASRDITPTEAYELGKDRLRRFLAKFRKAIGRRYRWAWKLEVHHDDGGYPHWHLAMEYTQRIPQELFTDIERWWGLGRINIRRIHGKDMDYLWKYFCKGIEDLPLWLSHYKGRIRVFQACAGFWTNRKPRRQDRKDPRTCLMKVDLITREKWHMRKAAIVTTTKEGKRLCRVIRLPFTFLQALMVAANEAIRKGVPLVAPNVIELNEEQKLILINEHKKWIGLGAIPGGTSLGLVA